MSHQTNIHMRAYNRPSVRTYVLYADHPAAERVYVLYLNSVTCFLDSTSVKLIIDALTPFLPEALS